MVLYHDAATDRLRDRARMQFEHMVEAARMGTIFAHQQRQYERWRRSVDRSAGRVQGAVGAALEAQIRSLAMTNPEYVTVG